MEITLKNVKTNLALSDETICFSATFYVDGKKAGTCSNRGHGGQTDYRFDDRDLGQRVREYFKSLPEEPVEGYDFTHQPCLPTRIDELVQEFLTERENKKNTKTGIIYRLKSTPVHQYTIYGYKRGTAVSAAMRAALVSEIKESHGDEIVEIIDGTKWWGARRRRAS